MNQIRLQDSRDSEKKSQDVVTTIKYLVKLTMMVDNKVQNKTLSWLLNVIIYIIGPDTMVNE